MNTRNYLALAATSALLTIATTTWALPPRQHSVRGVIRDIDRANRTITLKSAKRTPDAAFSWNDHTRFAKLGGCAACSLRSGQIIRVRYRREIGMNVLREVTLNSESVTCRCDRQVKPRASGRAFYAQF
jgi:hypothetical protein